MSDKLKNCKFTVVDLANGVKINTTISEANHSALRSGFARHPVNPRWTPLKYLAWKTGVQLRAALTRGDMVVRSADSLLVPASGEECAGAPEGRRVKNFS